MEKFKHPLALNEGKPSKANGNAKFYNLKLFFFSQLHNLAVSRFEWENLPDEIQPFIMEDYLFWDGSCLMIYDETIDMYGITKYALMGEMDIYGYPEIRYSFAPNSYQTMRNKWDSVICYDRPIPYSNARNMMMYAETLANLWMTREINLYSLRTPVVMGVPKNMELSYDYLIKDYNNYLPILKYSDELDLNKLNVLKLDTPVLFDKIEQQIHQVKCQALVDLGFNVSAIEKKERVQSKEVEQKQDEGIGCRLTYLSTRERFANAVNKTFGLDVAVKFRTESYIDALNFIDTVSERIAEEGDQNDSLYNED